MNMNEATKRQFKEAENHVRGFEGYDAVIFSEAKEFRPGCWMEEGSGSADGMPTRIVWSQETGWDRGA